MTKYAQGILRACLLALIVALGGIAHPAGVFAWEEGTCECTGPHTGGGDTWYELHYWGPGGSPHNISFYDEDEAEECATAALPENCGLR